MSTTAQDIQQIIDSVARSGALTPDAIRQFDELRKRCEDSESKAATAEKGIEALLTERSALEREIIALTRDLDAARKNLGELNKTAANAEKALWIADFERSRREEMRSILGDVFRNVEFRREMFGSVVPAPSANPSYYPPPSVPVSETVVQKAG